MDLIHINLLREKILEQVKYDRRFEILDLKNNKVKDLFEYYSKYGGCVLNSTLSLIVEVTIIQTNYDFNEYISLDTNQKIQFSIYKNPNKFNILTKNFL